MLYDLHPIESERERESRVISTRGLVKQNLLDGFFPLCVCAQVLFIMLHKHCSKHTKSRRAAIKVFNVAAARSKRAKAKTWQKLDQQSFS